MSTLNIKCDIGSTNQITTFTVTNNEFNIIKVQWQIYLNSNRSLPIANIITPYQRSDSNLLNATNTLLKYSLEKNINYAIRIRLFNGIGWSNWSNFVTFDSENKSIRIPKLTFPIKTAIGILSGEKGACCLPSGECVFITPDECTLLGGTYQGKDISCEDVYCNDLSPWSFLSLGFSTNINSLSEDDQNSIYDILAVHWGAHSPSVVPISTFNGWNEYRLKVLTRNPNAIVAPYYSIMTTQNPLYPTEADYNDTYMYSGEEFPDGGWTGTYVAVSTTQANLDGEGFLLTYNEDLPGGTFSTTPGGRPWGFYGRWPFYLFKTNNWLMNQSTYLGRPVIDFSKSGVIDFVINEVVNAVGETGRFPYSNGIAFDNGALWTGPFDNWVGKNYINLSTYPNYPGGISPLSPFANTPIDSASNSYLDQVKAALNNVNAKLVLNTSNYVEAAGHVDIILTEEFIMSTDMSPTTIKNKITGFKYALDSNTGIVFYCVGDFPWRDGSRLDQYDSTVLFLLAFSMILYERNLYSCSFNMVSSGTGYYKEFFELPKFLQAAVSDYQNPKNFLFYREFQNGIVILNINNSDYTLSQDEYNLYGFNNYNNIPLTIPSKTGIIRLVDFESVGANTERCQEIYS